MKHFFAFFTLAILGLGCGTLKSKESFVKEDLSRLNQVPFELPGVSLADAQKRLYEYAGRCLGMVGGDGVFTSTYTPSIEQEGSKTVLYLAFVIRGSFGSSGAGYVFVSKIWKDSKPNTVQGLNYYYDPPWGPGWSEVSNRLIPWLKSEKKLCPPLPG